MADDQVAPVLNAARIGIFVCAFFVLKIAGRGLLLSLLEGQGEGQARVVIATAALFAFGTFALFAVFGGSRFKSPSLLGASATGACAAALMTSSIACDGHMLANPAYVAYLCSNPALKWFVGGLCGLLLLLVALRRRS